MNQLTPFGVGLVYGLIIGVAVTLALVIAAFFIAAEFKQHQKDLE